jgi:hypothetical protein
VAKTTHFNQDESSVAFSKDRGKLFILYFFIIMSMCSFPNELFPNAIHHRVNRRHKETQERESLRALAGHSHLAVVVGEITLLYVFPLVLR